MDMMLTQSSALSTRLTGLLYGVVMSTIVLASSPGFERTTQGTHDVAQTTIVAETIETVVPARSAAKPAGPDKKTLATYLAREWKLGGTYAAQVATAVVTSAQRYRVDPLLLLAVAAAESSLQHSVGNPGGGNDPMKPYGIMQVAGQYHTEKFPGGVVRRTSIVENVDIGARVLQQCLNLEDGNERRALLRYNGSLKLNDKYFRKVSRFKQRLARELSIYQIRAGADQPA